MGTTRKIFGRLRIDVLDSDGLRTDCASLKSIHIDDRLAIIEG